MKIIKHTAAYLFCFLFCLSSAAQAETLCERIAANANAKNLGEFEVDSVIDGDTIAVKNKDGKKGTFHVRFIGVNAPETKTNTYGKPAQPLADEATALIKNAIKASGGKVELYSEGRDKSYERFLRWAVVKTPDGKRELGELLVAAGLGTVYKNNDFIPDAKEREILAALETKAKAAKKGIWALPPSDKKDNAAVAESKDFMMVLDKEYVLQRGQKYKVIDGKTIIQIGKSERAEFTIEPSRYPQYILKPGRRYQVTNGTEIRNLDK